jgi:hypothetical protein
VLILFVALFYLTIVTLLRFWAVQELQVSYELYVSDPYSMDDKTAHEIMKLAMLYDVPWMYFFGSTWALVETYGIATVHRYWYRHANSPPKTK